MPFADLVRLIRAGTFEQFVKYRKAALKSDAFYMHLLGFSQQPTLVVTDPADFVDIMQKEGKLNLCVQMPDTAMTTHGPGNLQLLSGVRHNFLRKMFAQLLHPNTLERFLPYFYEEFTNMWAKLDRADGEVIIQDAICEAQFFLMAKILYGMTPENTDLGAMRQLQNDFDVQMKGHFASPKSKTFREAKEASQSIRRVFNPMFDAVLEKRRRLIQTGDLANEATNDDLPVGNAMESIADALLKDNVQDDEQIRSDVYDNLNLLLEASHGTTSKLICHYLPCMS
jgi:cytochrome P450